MEAQQLVSEGLGSVVYWTRGQMGPGFVWSPAPDPVPDGDMDYPMSGFDREPRGEGRDAPYVMLDVALWGDYSGSAVDRANYFDLLEMFPDEVIPVYGDFWSRGIVVPAGAELSDELEDTLLALHHYPVIDDETLANVEMQITEEAWDSYGQRDFEVALAEAIGGPDTDVFDVADQMPEPGDLWRVYWDACGVAGRYPEAESAVDAVLHIDETAEIAAEIVLEAWRAPYVDPNQLTIEGSDNMPNMPVEDHPWVGATRMFRADLPPYDPAEDSEPGVLVVGAGMSVRVQAVFHDWNDVVGLTILWVHCSETGQSTHVTPADLGLTDEGEYDG